MSTEQLQQKIKQNVIERVAGGEVVMRSRTYFVARAAFTIVVSLLVLVLSAYVLSFIAFSVHESGEQLLLGFGVRGVQTFLVLFPWITLLIDIVLIACLDWLLQGFKFGYRIPTTLLLGAIAVASIALASVIAATPLHSTMLGMADRHDLPLVGDMYEGIRDSHEEQGVFRGTIASIQGNHIVITHDDEDHDADDGTRIVVLPTGYSTTTFSVGERVYVFGVPGSSTVQAYGVDQLSPDQ